MFLKALSAKSNYSLLSVCFLVAVFASIVGCSSSDGNSTVASPSPDSNSRVKAFRASRTGNKYIAFLDGLNFFEAWQMCQSYGLKLASATSPAETNELKVAIVVANPPNGVKFWIAGTDVGRSKSFLWITSGLQIWRPNFYLNWRAGEPNNAGGNEHCVEVYQDGQAGWNDRNCDVRQGYVCQLGVSGC